MIETPEFVKAQMKPKNYMTRGPQWAVAVWLLAAVCCVPITTRAQDSFFPKGTNLTSLVVISDGALSSPAQKFLIATLQGLVAWQSSQQIYIDGGSGYSIWDNHLSAAYGIPMTSVNSPWAVLSQFKGLVNGYIRCNLSANTNSINAATSLCGPFNAIAVDVSIESTVRSYGITNCIADVSAASDQFAWTNPNYNALLSHRVVVEQAQSIAENLRDYAVMANAFTLYEGENSFRSSVMFAMNPDSVALGWGDDESGSVGNSSSHGVFTCGSDWALDLSTLSSVRDSSIYQQSYTNPTPETNVHYVTFIVTDGDNVQWNLGGLPGYFNSSARGSFNMGWALSPSLADLAPSALRWYYDNSTKGDFFVAGPSGIGYFYPSMYPAADLGLHVQKLNDFMTRADLNVCQIIDFNSFNRLDLWNQYLAQPSIDGLIYLDWAPYNGAHGAILWSTNGKPVIGVRDLLWAGLEEESDLIAKLNSYPTDTSSPQSYTVVSVHVWSKNLSNVQQVVTNLAPHVRVVTPDAFVKLVRNNVGRRLSFDFSSGLQGWAAGNAVVTNSTLLGPVNPGFEQGGVAWSAGGTGGAKGSINFFNSQNGLTASGANCVSETSDGTGNTDFRANAFSLGAAAGGASPVTFSFDYNILNPITSNNNVRVGLRFFDSTGTIFRSESNCHVGSSNGDVGGDGWHHVFVTATPPANTSMADIRVSMNIFGDDKWSLGAVLFDNFAVSVGAQTSLVAQWTGTVGNPSGALQLDGSDLGHPDSSPNSSFSRQIILPSNATALSFDTMASNDGLLRVRLQKADGTFATLLDWFGLTNHNVWDTQTASMAAYAGQTVTLFFEQNDGGLGVNEQCFIDNVAILTSGSPLYVPTAPKLLLAASTNGIISLLWRDNDNNESGFKVERTEGTNGAWTEIASLASNVTTYVDKAVVPGTSYSYRVRSWNGISASPYSNVRPVTALFRSAIAPVNPGFENGGYGWNTGGTGGAAGSINFFNLQNGLEAPGTNCVSITSDGTGNTDFRANAFSLGAAATGTNTATLSFDYNILNPVAATNNVRVGFRFFDSAGTVFQGEKNSYIGANNGDLGGNGWQHFSVTFTPPASAYTADIRVSMNVFGDDTWKSGPVLFDNFMVIIGSNRPPVASNFTIGALAGVPVTLQIVGGTHAPTDNDADPLAVTVLGTPGHGIASTDGTSITYTANAGYAGTDSLTYVVSDGVGGVAQATVTVLVSAQGVSWLEAPVIDNGNFKLTFQGAPLSNYALEWTDDLTRPINWRPQATNSSSDTGVLEFTNLQSGKAGFWRTRYVPFVP